MAKNSKQFKLPKNAVSKSEFVELAQQATELVQQHRAAAQIASETLSAGRAAFTEADGTREERLARTRNSVIEFGKTYLPHFFEQPGAEFHEALDKLLTGNYTTADLERWAEEFGIEIHVGDPVLNLLSICLPRGFGKSVLAILCDFLRRICHGLDPYLIIGSDTLDQASSQLEDIKEELTSNEKIKADFGSLKPEKGLWQKAELIHRTDGRVVWREGRIITTNRIRVDAIGRGGKMRGRRFGQKRPSYIVLDDLDNDENVVTKEQRDKAWGWVISAVEPARDPQVGRIVVIGTVVHFDCVVARANQKTDEDGVRLFTSIKFSAMRFDEEKEEWFSNWEARFPVKVLLRKRTLLGAIKFGAEYMNNPRDPETQIFKAEDFYYYPYSELKQRNLRRIMYVDPSKGKKGKGRKKSDYSGFADVLVDSANRVTYIRDAFRKRLSPSAAKSFIADWFIGGLEGEWQVEFWVEENAFGDILSENFQDELRRRGVDLVINTLLHTVEKEGRLERHSMRIDSKGVRFPQKWESSDRRPEWFSEYEDFPAGAFDDTIDALESADDIGMNHLAGDMSYKATGQKLGSSKMGGF